MYACFRRLRSDISCLYLEEFSFKLRVAWSDRLENYILRCAEIINLTAWFAVLHQRIYFIFLQRVCSKVILPGCPDECRHLIYVIATDYLNHTTWSNGSCWRIPRGVVAFLLFHADQVMCDWLNHTTWFHSNRALPRSLEFEAMLLNFFTQYSRQYAM